MAQLLVRNLSEAAKQRLKRRAKLHGRSLEAEVRELLEKVPDEKVPVEDTTGWASRLAEEIRQIGVTKEDVDELERIIAEGRKGWRVKPIEFK